MPSLSEATLSATERRVLERLVGLLQEELRGDLRAVWLYGSRARGEQPGPESDVDLLIVSEGGRATDGERVSQLVREAARREGADSFDFSAHVYTPDRVAERREIRSFFMQEVDRDKIVLYGDP